MNNAPPHQRGAHCGEIGASRSVHLLFRGALWFHLLPPLPDDTLVEHSVVSTQLKPACDDPLASVPFRVAYQERWLTPGRLLTPSLGPLVCWTPDVFFHLHHLSHVVVLQQKIKG